MHSEASIAFDKWHVSIDYGYFIKCKNHSTQI